MTRAENIAARRAKRDGYEEDGYCVPNDPPVDFSKVPSRKIRPSAEDTLVDGTLPSEDE